MSATKSARVLAGTVKLPGASIFARKCAFTPISKFVAESSTEESLATNITFDNIGRLLCLPATELTRFKAYDRFSLVQVNCIFIIKTYKQRSRFRSIVYKYILLVVANSKAVDNGDKRFFYFILAMFWNKIFVENCA